MRIEHLAIWTDDIAKLKAFYCKYFQATAGSVYSNPTKGFESCFLKFQAGARLELMKSTRLDLARIPLGSQPFGLTHFAVSVGTMENVDALTLRLKNDGVLILDGPRWTGDGYYESVVIDPGGNLIELTV